MLSVDSGIFLVGLFGVNICVDMFFFRLVFFIDELYEDVNMVLFFEVENMKEVIVWVCVLKVEIIGLLGFVFLLLLFIFGVVWELLNILIVFFLFLVKMIGLFFVG